ncbi:AAA family ATPase [Pseudidiomarina sp. YC-516-91]|uniref:AAA family ATPase n=1 Tax=Pseudidiomarina salilacus TaxID=3384452 RepID=UPI0039855041
MEKQSSFSVYFCSEPLDFRTLKEPSIFLMPSEDNWNDFTYRCAYEYFIHLGSGSDPINGNLMLGFISNDERVNHIGRLRFESDLINAEELPTFFTIQRSMNDYRMLVRQLGHKNAEEALKSLNDLVALKKTGGTNRFLVSKATETEVFKLSFMRDSERFYAFHNASSILDGLDEESFSSISTKLSLSYQLPNFSVPHNFELNFETNSILPKRISILIGKNGLGKSQALYTVAHSLITNGTDFQDREIGRPLINRLLAIATPGETVNTFPPERVRGKIKYRRLILNRNARAKAQEGFCDLCVQLARSIESIGSNDRWDLFQQAIRTLPNINNIHIPLKSNPTAWANHIRSVRGKHYVPLLRLKEGGEQARLEIQGSVVGNANPVVLQENNAYPLSSGQLAFLKFTVQACLFIENGTLVLLDEPETHLHPNFISEFVTILDRLLELTGSIALIATHSAYFVREVPRSQVLVFKAGEDNQVVIQNPRIKTFGADVGAISYFAFEDEITNALVAKLINNLPSNKQERDIILNELKEELSSDVIMYLHRKLNEDAIYESD